MLRICGPAFQCLSHSCTWAQRKEPVHILAVRNFHLYILILDYFKGTEHLMVRLTTNVNDTLNSSYMFA